MTHETPYALRLRTLGFVRYNDQHFFDFEVNGILVTPIGRVYARIESPDHLTVVRDENGFQYRIHELVPSQHLLGKDVTKFITTQGTMNGQRRLRGRAYVAPPNPHDRPRSKSTLHKRRAPP